MAVSVDSGKILAAAFANCVDTYDLYEDLVNFGLPAPHIYKYISNNYIAASSILENFKTKKYIDENGNNYSWDNINDYIYGDGYGSFNADNEDGIADFSKLYSKISDLYKTFSLKFQQQDDFVIPLLNNCTKDDVHIIFEQFKDNGVYDSLDKERVLNILEGLDKGLKDKNNKEILPGDEIQHIYNKISDIYSEFSKEIQNDLDVCKECIERIENGYSLGHSMEIVGLFNKFPEDIQKNPEIIYMCEEYSGCEITANDIDIDL